MPFSMLPAGMRLELAVATIGSGGACASAKDAIKQRNTQQHNLRVAADMPRPQCGCNYGPRNGIAPEVSCCRVEALYRSRESAQGLAWARTIAIEEPADAHPLFSFG